MKRSTLLEVLALGLLGAPLGPVALYALTGAPW